MFSFTIVDSFLVQCSRTVDTGLPQKDTCYKEVHTFIQVTHQEYVALQNRLHHYTIYTPYMSHHTITSRESLTKLDTINRLNSTIRTLQQVARDEKTQLADLAANLTSCEGVLAAR